jgi:hypothetical protein
MAASVLPMFAFLWDVNMYGWHSGGIFIQQNKQLKDKKLKSCWISSEKLAVFLLFIFW